MSTGYFSGVTTISINQNRILCYDLFIIVKFLAKQFIDIQPDEKDKNNWEIIRQILEVANKVTSASWNSKSVEDFEEMIVYLHTGLQIIKKYKPDFEYQLTPMNQQKKKLKQ